MKKKEVVKLMTKQKKKVDLSKKVMKQIKKKQIKMRPKLYFVIGSVLLGIGMAGIFLLTAFFSNLILFRLRVHQPFSFFALGRPGLRPFLLTFPWQALLLTIGGVISGSILLKKYDVSYKKSFKGLIITLITVVLVLCYLLSKTRVNQSMQRVKRLKPFYQNNLTEDEKQILKEQFKKINRKPPFNERKSSPLLYKR